MENGKKKQNQTHKHMLSHAWTAHSQLPNDLREDLSFLPFSNPSVLDKNSIPKSL
jgi:hypothetical protein